MEDRRGRLSSSQGRGNALTSSHWWPSNACGVRRRPSRQTIDAPTLRAAAFNPRRPYHAAMKRGLLIATLCLATALPAHPQQPPAWRDTYQSRLEILALLQTLNVDLLANSSATRTLEQWCGDHHMAADPKIVASRVADIRKEPSPEQLQRLDVHAPSEVRYRRVQLRCGAHILSEADNWYVPSRLTA